MWILDEPSDTLNQWVGSDKRGNLRKENGWRKKEKHTYAEDNRVSMQKKGVGVLIEDKRSD